MSTLLHEKCAEGIRETLERNGVIPAPPPPEPVQPPAPSANSTASTDYGRSSSSGLSLPAKNPQKMAAQQGGDEKKDKVIAFLTEYSASYTTNNDEALLATAKELKRV